MLSRRLRSLSSARRQSCNARRAFRRGIAEAVRGGIGQLDHLIEAADYYERAGKVTEHAFTQLRDAARHPGGTEWDGQAAQADQYRAEMDLVAITPAVLQWHDAAAICRDGYEQMESTRRAVLDAANDARHDGFEVGDDYTVTDTRTSSTREEQTARQAQGKAHAAYISHRVAALAATDHDIAARLTTASEGLDGITFEEAPTAAEDTIVSDDKHNGVRPVDRTWKQDPAPTPNPNDPGRHPDYPDHKPDGTWARSNSGLDGYPEEQQALDEREKQTGIPIERQKVRVTLTDPNTGRTLTREYDGLEPIPGQPGQYRGLEHKLGAAGLTPNQRQFDGLVDSGTPARGTLNGKPIEVIDMRVMKTPQPFPTPAERLPGAAPGASAGPGSASVINPPPNLPPTLSHPPVAPAPVQPAHPAPAAIPPTVLDHPPLPPWLQNPSPPGFDVHPGEPPLFAPLDTPGDSVPPPQHGPPITLHMPQIHTPDLPPPTPQQQQGLLAVLGGLVVGGLATFGEGLKGLTS